MEPELELEADGSSSQCKTPAELENSYRRENTTPSSLKLSGLVRRHKRQRARPSPLTDSVRRRLLAKICGTVAVESKRSKVAELVSSSSSNINSEVAGAELESSTKSEVAEVESSTKGEVAEVESSTKGEVAELASTTGTRTNITFDTLKGFLSKDRYSSLHVQTLTVSDKTAVIVDRPYNDNSVGLISNPRLCLSEVEEGIEYSFQVFYNTIASGCCSNDMSEIECYLSQLLTTSSYAVCPGVREYPSCIQFKTKNLVVWKEPFNRYFSTKCSQWHIPNNVHQVHIPNSTAFNCCKACKQLIHDIRQLQRSSEAVSDTTRAQRRSASSQYSISRLSPESQAIRRADKIIKKQRKKKLSRLLPSTS